MDPRKVFCSVSVIALALLMAASGRARAIAIWPSMPGSWVGYGQSSMIDSRLATFDVSFDKIEQQRGQFMGKLLINPGEKELLKPVGISFLCDGSVQPSSANNPKPDRGNVVNATGISQDGALIIVVHGKTVLLGDGSVRFAALRYEIYDPKGALLDRGYLLLMQLIGGPEWNDLKVPDILGIWPGVWASVFPEEAKGRADLGVGTQKGTAFGGKLTFYPPKPEKELLSISDEMGFGILGTIGPLSDEKTIDPLPTPTPVAMIGRGGTREGIAPQEVFAILIGQLGPSEPPEKVLYKGRTIAGDYMLYGSLADIYQSIWQGADLGFEHGTFRFSDDKIE